MISIHIDTGGGRGRPPLALLPEQLQAYLHELRDVKELQRLAVCDPYDDTRFSVDDAKILLHELNDLAPLVETRSVPEPPAYVGDHPGDIPEEEYGWPSLESFCHDLRHVCEKAIQQNAGIVACGD